MVSYLPPSDRTAGLLPGSLPDQMRLKLHLLSLMLLAPAFAQAQASQLYSGTVPVADQGQEAREQAFPLALEQVLGKLSGLRTFDERPEVATGVQNARSLVVSFYYEHETLEDTGAAESVPSSGGAKQQTYLVARFAPEGVDELMRSLGLPRWPQSRSPLGIWVLIDDGVSRRVLPLEYEYLRDPVNREADLRGLPLDWPEPGPEGEYMVDVQLLWGGYTEETLSPGSSGNVLIIAARREGPEWSARLILEYEGDHWTWRSRNIDLEQSLVDSMNQVVDEIAAVHAIAPSDQGLWVHEILVSGMTSANDYSRCLAYLQSLSVVDEVSVTAAAPDGVRMSIYLNAVPEYLEQALEEGRVLEPGDVSGHYVLQR
jgi:hypothetical protein